MTPALSLHQEGRTSSPGISQGMPHSCSQLIPSASLSAQPLPCSAPALAHVLTYRDALEKLRAVLFGTATGEVDNDASGYHLPCPTPTSFSITELCFFRCTSDNSKYNS